MWENEQQWKLQFSTQLLSQTPVSPTETVTQQRLNRCSYLNQVFSGEKRQANVFHQVSQVFLPDVFVVVDPSYHSLKNLQSEVHRHTVNHIWYNCLFTLPYLIYRAGCVCACVCMCVCVCVPSPLWGWWACRWRSDWILAPSPNWGTLHSRPPQWNVALSWKKNTTLWLNIFIN